MKTIEVWTPVFAAPAASIETALPKRTTPTQADSQEFAGVETIDLEEFGIPSPVLPSSTTRFGKTLFGMRSHNVSVSVLSDNLKNVLTNFQQLVNDVPKPASGYFIDEIEINLGVNGSGGIALIGKMEVGMEAGIKVRIKRETK